MGRFDGRVVLVTGAASGIGQATATRLLAEGATVVGADVNAPSAPAGSDRWIPMTLDVRDEAAVAAAVARCVEVGGRIDGAFTAAGVASGGPVHLVDAADWQRVLDVNLTGTFLVLKHAAARMLGQEPIDGQRGSLVTVASVEGLEGTAGGSSYNASKGGGRHADQERRHRLRAARHPLQLHLPGLHRHAAAAQRVRRAGQRRGHRGGTRTSTRYGASAGRRRSRLRPRSCCRATRRS